MRTSIVIFLLILSHQGIVGQKTDQEKLYGTWQLAKSSGGITGRGFSTKHKRIIEFTEDCRHHVYINDSLVHSTDYRLAWLTPLYAIPRIRGMHSKIKRKMLLTRNGISRQLLQVSDSTLVLKEDAADGITSVYKKLNSPRY